jgi:amino acid adenylation domain-containing protein
MDKMIIHSVFDHIVERFPGNLAVNDGARMVTYRRINEYANHVAHALAELGIGRENVVGIFLEGSLEYIVAMLGVLKAGAVFMPLNIRFPDDRLASILEKTRPDAVITIGPLENPFDLKVQKFIPWTCPSHKLVLSDSFNLRVKCLPRGETLSGDRSYSEEKQVFKSGPDDSCYIITTSGSTGKPKAILGSQKGLSHFIHWEVDEFGLNENVRVSLLSPVTFDVSLRDIFVPLITGGTLCIPDEETRHNPGKLFKWLHGNGITLIHIVPTLFRMLTREIEDLGVCEKALPDLRYVLIAGEPLYGNDVIRWREACGNRAELVNFYGPSETTLAKLFSRIGYNNFVRNEIVPIGRPIPNTEVLIIKNGEPCSEGEVGEIFIKTPFMSKGYYNDPTLNKLSFVQNPLVKGRIDVVYKTGDLGKLLPDGNVAFVGRLDGQIKLHGKRVEIGEIELILRQHPQLQEAAIAAKQDAFGNMRLVGYVVPKPGEKPTVESLRRLLGEKLPDYMVPALFVILKALPLTHNEKIDRRSLPEPGYLRPEMEQGYVAPSTATQGCVSGIWGDVLILDRAGVYDNFFMLGGDSLLATQIISRIKRIFQVDFPLQSFFENPTVAGLSEEIEKLMSEGKASQISPIKPISRESRRMKGSF